MKLSGVSLQLSGRDAPCMESLLSCDVEGSNDSDVFQGVIVESQVICSSEGSCVAVNLSGDENDSRGGLNTGGCVGDDDGVNGVANGFSDEWSS